ncbi:diguanylate cyclase [Gilvimarinus sp. SDUM040013]|uniref:diguanylate cyclase n=1 Tax=Gilvimarinus gilvus TaxID=3058038 RepID=A0ABU4RXK5_9GAMM|nr:diguanylate cyclase [Gilvimarinus sp. SDUM040013]MDO3388735.1 diguanylate cyclase [Gilvimarinus sp. SDUM040013]MDX6849630.1 diguanylate cyclase [Gilvimarinus sp. SDUM040013]
MHIHRWVFILSLVFFSVMVQADSGLAGVTWHIEAIAEDQPFRQHVDDPIALSNWQVLDQPSHVLTQGFSASAYWLRLSLENLQERPLSAVLMIEVPWLDYIDVYQAGYDESMQRLAAMGDLRPYQRANFAFTFPKVEVVIPAGQSYLYLRVESQEALIVPIALVSPQQHTEVAIYQGVYFGLLYGGLLIISVYNVFLFLIFRNRDNLYYVLFVATFILGSASYNGLLYHFGLHQYPKVATEIHPHLFFLYQYVGLIFISRLLNIKNDYPIVYKLIKGFAGLLVITHIVMIAVNSAYFSQTVSVVTSGFYGLVLFSTCVYIFGKRGLTSVLATYGVFSSLIGTLITTLTVVSVVPYTFATFRSIEFGFVIDAVLLSFALAANKKYMFKVRERMQTYLLQQENLKKIELEALVKERTENLESVNQKLTRLAVTDELTQLLNRSGGNTSLQDSINCYYRYNRIFSIMMIDIDFFKKVNDSYGHQVGDAVLVAVAKIIKDSVRACDVCCRWGGEEFLIVCPESDMAGAKRVASEILTKVRESKMHPVETITLSIGLAEVKPGDDINSVIANADSQLYRAKTEGRNRISSVVESS